MGKAKEAAVVAGALAFTWLLIELAFKPFLTKARASIDNSDPSRDPDDDALPKTTINDVPNVADSKPAGDVPTAVDTITTDPVLSVVGLLQDEVDPMVFVMKVEKAPLESYVDIGGLDAQIQEIKEAVKLPLTHPELYEDIHIKPPKGVILYGEPGTGKTLLAKVLLGRATQSVPVDIDLGINGGHVNAISRRHVNKLTNKLYVK
ncbi:probable 26S proteasome subunit rpt4 [Glycine soja]|nr:probable 26S proteasome subunit rpt4 [Glycine soja]